MNKNLINLRNTLQGLPTAVLLCAVSMASAQELTVKSFTSVPTDISASKYPRQDLTKNYCGLVKVQLAVAGAQFEGNVIAPVENKTGEYWVYMTEGSKELVVKTPSTMPLHVNFGDYQISGIVPKATYVLALSSPQTAGNQKQQVSLRYSPANAMVLIDDQAYQSANGQLALSLPLGDHSYIVSSPGYDTVKGSFTLLGGDTKRLNVPLERIEPIQDVAQVTEVVTSPADAHPQSVVSPPQTTALSNKSFTVNGVSFNMILVEGGTFTMGATLEQEKEADENEKPAHQVMLPSYYIGETEVTQELWMAVMGSNPSRFNAYGDGVKRPVEIVSWEDCQTFISKLNSLVNNNFRLPTEAEWEYAARGGKKSKGYKYSGSDKLDNVGVYIDNSGVSKLKGKWIDKVLKAEENRCQTHYTAMKRPNELGIYDMSGNVAEWCQDWYDSYYIYSETYSPQGPASGTQRVVRGGSWNGDPWDARISRREYAMPDFSGHALGLRLALSKDSDRAALQDNRTVKIHVIDQYGEPLVGAGVQYSDNRPSQVVDPNGNCSFTNAHQGDTMEITYIGFDKYVLTIDARDSYEVILRESR